VNARIHPCFIQSLHCFTDPTQTILPQNVGMSMGLWLQTMEGHACHKLCISWRKILIGYRSYRRGMCLQALSQCKFFSIINIL
jgi:hypothetical protein